jgi:hypothetical protein
MKFPTEWKNKNHVPNQPDMVLDVFVVGINMGSWRGF